MYRKIERKIEKWIRSSKNAMLITGARQVGKHILFVKLQKSILNL